MTVAVDPIAGLIVVALIVILGLVTMSVIARHACLPQRMLTLGLVVLIGHLVVGGVYLAVAGLGGSDAQAYHLTATDIAAYLLGHTDTYPGALRRKAGLGLAARSALRPGDSNARDRTCRQLGPVGHCSFSGVPLGCPSAPSNGRGLPRGRAQRGRARVLGLGNPAAPRSKHHLPAQSRHVFRARTAVASSAVSWAGLLATLGLLYLFRGSFSVVVAASVLLALGLSIFARGRSINGFLLAIPGTIVGLLFVQLAVNSVGDQVSVERISVVRTSQQSRADTAFANGGEVSTTQETVVGALSTLPRVTLGPFPWEIRGGLIVLLPDIVFYLVVLVSAVGGLRLLDRQAHRLLLLLPVFGLLVALAVYSGNYGTVIRLRAMAYPFRHPGRRVHT